MKYIVGGILLVIGSIYVGHCSADGYIPFGTGTVVHVCGEIVDENLNPIKDDFKMTVRVTRPLLTIKGNSKIDEYKKTFKGPGFCLNYAYAWDVVAFLENNKYESPTLSIGKGMLRNDFKWVVVKKDTIIENPDLKPCTFIYSELDSNRSYSSSQTCFDWMKNRDSDWGVGEAESEVEVLSKMNGTFDPKKKKADAVKEWLKEHPEMFRFDPKGRYSRYTLLRPVFFADIIMDKHDDSLVLKPGRLAKTKFAEATIDSPACNVSRMANPPSLGSAAWRDSLVIAKSDKVLVDGFYAYFPWNNYWAKALLDTVVIKQKNRLVVRYLLMQEAVKEHPTFPNKINGYDDFFLRKKCLTKAEKMWAGKYKTYFKSE